MNPENDETKVEIPDEEWDEAVKSAEKATNIYTLRLRNPFEYEEKRYEELAFNFAKLKCKDGMQIATELRRRNIALVSPEFNDEYLIRFAARCCLQEIGVDVIGEMSNVDWLSLRSAASSFLFKQQVEPAR